jgi:hypothetical protein
MRIYLNLFALAAIVTLGCKEIPPNDPNRNAPAFQPNSSGSPISPNAAVPAGVAPPATNQPPNDMAPPPNPVMPPANPPPQP